MQNLGGWSVIFLQTPSKYAVKTDFRIILSLYCPIKHMVKIFYRPSRKHILPDREDWTRPLQLKTSYLVKVLRNFLIEKKEQNLNRAGFSPSMFEDGVLQCNGQKPAHRKKIFIKTIQVIWQ